MQSRSVTTFDNKYTHMKYRYFVTIQKSQVKDYVTEDELNNVFNILKAKNPKMVEIHIVYELGKKYRQLHIHAVVATNKPIFFRDNCKINGFRLFWKNVYSNAVHEYMQKDVCNSYQQEELFIENYSNHHYLF